MFKKANLFDKFHLTLAVIVLAGFLIRLAVIVIYGSGLTLDSDDMGYVRSAKNLLESGMLTYHRADMPTVHIMPGQSFLLAAIFFIFGTGSVGFLAGKLFFILLGTVNIILVYKVGEAAGNKFIGLLSAAMLAVFIPQVLTDNLFITETPFLCALLVTILYSIKLANEPTNWRYFFLLMAGYLTAIMFKATFALFPFLLLVYLLIKKYPFKKVGLKQFGVAALLLVIILGPWWIRNYVQFGDFIPLTGGGGNPLLLGTFQGSGIHYGDYQETVDALNEQYPIKSQDAYFRMQLQDEAAKERIRMWWEDDPSSFLRTYFVIKPIIQWDAQFYWIEIFNISKEKINEIHDWIVDWAIYSLFALVLFRKHWREYLLLAGVVFYHLVLNSVFYAFPRYNQPLMFILFISIATAVYVVFRLLTALYQLIANRKTFDRQSNESEV